MSVTLAAHLGEPPRGRPRGEVSDALLRACAHLATTERGATLRELAEASQVGTEAARWAVHTLRRAGHLVCVRHRRVAYRNRPVAEYVPADLAPKDTRDAGVHLMQIMQAWG